MRPLLLVVVLVLAGCGAHVADRAPVATDASNLAKARGGGSRSDCLPS
jgi:hypothetical protein